MCKKHKYDGEIRNVHLIEYHDAFKHFVTRRELKNPRSMEFALIRFVREMAQCELEEVTPLHLEHAVHRINLLNYRPQYVKRLIGVARTFFSWCNAYGYIKSDVGRTLHLPSTDAYEMPVELDPQITATLERFTRAEGTGNDIILVAALLAGNRISEPCRAVTGGIELDVPTGTPFLWVGTKTKPRRAQLPIWTRDALLTTKLASGGVENTLILQFVNTPSVWNPEWDTPPYTIRNQVLAARTYLARNRLYELMRGAGIVQKFVPKDLRSTIITRNVRKYPHQLMDHALQFGNSVQTIQSQYYNYTKVRDVVFT